MTTYFGKYDACGKNHINYNREYLNKLFEKECNKKEINNLYINVNYLFITELEDNAYIYNLRKLPDLIFLNIDNIKNILFYEELKNLKKLKEITINNFQNINNENYFNEISKCVNLETLFIDTNLNYFPKSLTNLVNVNDLFYSPNNLQIIKIKKVPPQILKMNKLYILSLNVKKKYIIRKNKMLIFNYDKPIKIPKYIRYLKIMNYDEKYINNLPLNIKILVLTSIKKIPIFNLPFELEKLYILYKLIDEINGEIEITHNDIKVPLGCKVFIGKIR